MITPLPFDIDTSVIPEVYPFFDEDSNTYSYVLRDPLSPACAVIDPVMDLDYAAGRTSYGGADKIVAFIEEKDWDNQWILETHVHADHLTAAPYIQKRVGGLLAIGDRITVVQETFGMIFEEGEEFKRDGSQFDQLIAEGDTYQIGNLNLQALHTPGHTPACMSYVIGDTVFVGDTLFLPDGGTARADFPGGDARTLYRSIQRLFLLPENMRLFVCHDYPEGRDPMWLTKIKDEKSTNIHVKDEITEDEFVEMREARDKTLSMPRLILPSLQVNMRGGHLPPPAASGKSFFKIPINIF